MSSKKLRYEAYQDWVNSREPLKRFAYIDDELPSSEPQFITPLLSNHTGNIQFVGASPHKGSFWISHPFRSRVYYYFENALQLAFNDYINEFVQLLQHLGATQVILEYINPNQNAEDPAAEKLPDDVTLPDRGRKMNITTLEYNFQPKQKAHLPTHLAWYASQPQWQSIVAERSQGSVTEFNIVLNSADILNFSPQDLEEVQEEYRDLLENSSKNIKNDALKQKRRQRKTFKQENTAVSLKRNWIAMECNIKVKFAPLSELTEEVNLQKIQTFDVELPEISLENRKMTSVDVTTIISEVIEKIEVEDKSKIKRENAREIPLQVEETAYDKWKKLTQKNTKKETEDKIEQIQPKRERGSLDEFLTETPTTPKETTNSTKQEQKQEKETKEELIDSMGLTQDERFYYEMLQHAYQDGTISEDVRKVLERRRQRFKISEERAKEIEQMMLDKKI
jgi:hypothetical protein